MNFDVVGGGPAGLYFAYLLKSRQPGYRVRVFEKNAATETYGWGVVFSGRALSFLRRRSPEVLQEIDVELERWSDLTIFHESESIRIDGSDFSAVSRVSLLRVLQRYAADACVELHFEHEVSDLTEIADTDLVVAADGIRSSTRRRTGFTTDIRYCDNRYIWYGVDHPFKTLSLIFVHGPDGFFVAHTYRYSATMSTFLVECDARTFENSGLATMNDAQSRAYCESVFEQYLHGQPLMSNHSEWTRFPIVSNRDWTNGRVVLIGDALRSVHFSIGSGTRTALEDAAELADCLAIGNRPLSISLDQFVTNRRAKAARLTEVAKCSLEWYENFGEYMSLAPYDFAMHYLLRGGALDHQTVRDQSPKFYTAWQEHCSHDQ